eukprot:TRINITY_DN2581_c0_g1_i1.p1 TRINITY_DN2581_c0_g1~~TRINITY_DN2581_c0_g1_i1.p1  ORF type:complete len:172 (+),score=10.24 TRINITY_DN2581_c0_g1_i1:156-671(+)
MSDTKWGFKSEYAHRHLPFKWMSTSGFNYFPTDLKETLRTNSTSRSKNTPVYREDFGPILTNYNERPQDERWNCSVYGSHRNMDWTSSLRSPRNPFPGRRTKSARDGVSREMRYTRQEVPGATWRTSSRPLSNVPRGFTSPRDAYHSQRVMDDAHGRGGFDDVFRDAFPPY